MHDGLQRGAEGRHGTPESASGPTMTQDERRVWLIEALIAEGRGEYAGIDIPYDIDGQRTLLRALLNVRPPAPAPASFLAVQDAYLRARIAEKGVTDTCGLEPVALYGPDADLAVWRGDITTLAADAIVNAANSRMLGCFQPNHACIDNAIHTFAGIQLRLACSELMRAQGHDEPTGSAKITPGFNLPARNVLHTVGPIVGGARPSRRDQDLLAGCYRSCLELAHERGLESVAFCCISTGVFGYPNRAAAEVAVREVREFKRRTGSAMRVVFNVFKPVDEQIYREILGGDGARR